MKHQLLFIAIMLAFGAFCQENDFTWSQRTAAPKSYAKVQKHLASENDAQVILWSGKATKNDPIDYWIERIPVGNEKSTFTAFSFRNVSNSSKPQKCEGIYRVNGRNYFTYTSYDKKAGLNAFYLNEILENGSKTGEIQVANLEPIGLINRGKYIVSISPDNTKFMVLGYDSYRRKGESQMISLTCVNLSDLSILWTTEQILPTNSQKLPKYSLITDNEGNCVFYNQYKEKGEGYKSNVFGYNVADGAISQFEMNLSDKQVIQSQKLALNLDGDFVFNGTYKDNGTGLRLQGNCMHGRVYLKISKGKESLINYKQALSTKFLEAAKYKGAEDVVPYLTNRKIRSTHFREDGNIILMLEYEAGSKTVIPGSNPVAYEYFVVRGEVLAICIDSKTGETSWVTNIPKYQKFSKSKNPNGIHEVSFISALNGNNLHYFYNSITLGNEWKDHDGTVYSKSNLYGSKTGRPIFKYILEPDGTLTYSDLKYGHPVEGIYKIEDRYNLSMMPRISFFDGTDMYFFATGSGWQHRYCKIKLTE